MNKKKEAPKIIYKRFLNQLTNHRIEFLKKLTSISDKRDKEKAEKVRTQIQNN